MRYLSPVLITAWALTLAACGSGSSSNSAAVAKAKAALSNDNATAAQVALAKRGNVQCPAAIHTPPRAAGIPVDDLEGVRPGLTYEEAADVVMCSDPLLVVSPEGGGFQIQQYGYKVRQAFSARNAQARKLVTREQYMHDVMYDRSDRMQPGETRWNVSTMGLPGKERVIAVWRDQWYAENKNPTIDSVKAALIGKYGKPTVERGDWSPKILMLCWSYDTSGAPMANACGSANMNGDIQVNDRSGIAVQAWITQMDNNHALARDVIVNVLDSAGGYAAILATEKGLTAMDAQRRAAEVKKAAQNAQAPKF